MNTGLYPKLNTKNMVGIKQEKQNKTKQTNKQTKIPEIFDRSKKPICLMGSNVGHNNHIYMK